MRKVVTCLRAFTKPSFVSSFVLALLIVDDNKHDRDSRRSGACTTFGCACTTFGCACTALSV